MAYYKVRDEDGTVIAQHERLNEPRKPDEWNGEWHVEVVDFEDLNNEPIEWWDE